MKKLLGMTFGLLFSLGLLAQTGGVSTIIRSGPSLPTGAAINSVFIVNGGGFYRCNVNPCTTAGDWSLIGGLRFAVNETPSGTIDGANTVFTLANTPAAGTLMLFRNGVLQAIGTNYTLATNTITFLSTFQPNLSDSLIALYQY